MTQQSLFQLPVAAAASAPAPAALPVAPLTHGSSFSYAGRRYQITCIDPTWGEHGKLVAADLSSGYPIARIFELDSFTQRTGYAVVW